MNPRRNILSRLLEAAQRRFRRARPGSVLIMVVALLVLLALIGTAAMSTARLDRVSSGQNVSNTQIEMLVEGVKNMVVGSVVADLFSKGVYRDKFTVGSSYDDWDSHITDPQSNATDTNLPGPPPNKSFDAWLGTRLPEIIISSSNTYGWRALSYSPIRTGTVYTADFPTDATPRSLTLPKMQFRPTFLTINSVDYPALEMFNNGASQGTFLAADADGDGVADSLYFKLPVGAIAGVTYYAAVRVIDNNSAINVNTALFRDRDFAGPSLAAVVNDGYFPTNIGLVEFMRDYVASDNTVTGGSQDFNRSLTRKGMIRLPAGMDGGTDNPLSESGGAVTPNFKYRTLADVTYMQLARRLDNPGRLDASVYFGNRVRPYSFSDGFTLAKRFVLRDATGSPASIESDLFNSTYRSDGTYFTPYTPYTPRQANDWFRHNFDYTRVLGGALTTPLRAMLVSHNPVSNYAAPHLPNASLFPGDSKFPVTPEFPTRISINTATKEDLWRGFYEVMCFNDLYPDFGRDDATAKAISDTSNGITDPFYGVKFAQAGSDTAASGYKAKTFDNVPEIHAGRMFRTPIRHTANKLSARQVMALRSAIAAANAEAMRDGKTATGPMAFNVTLTDSSGPAAGNLQATIYSNARQPFITEVFAHTDVNKVTPSADPKDARLPFKDKVNKKGFVAIELHNPYDTAIDLSNYKIAYVNRASVPLTMQLISDPTELAGKSIPPNGYVVLCNFDPANPGGTDYLAQYWPFSSVKPDASKIITVQKLPDALGAAAADQRELVILQPAANQAAAVLEDNVPVDSFDFTGLMLPAAEPAPAEAWHYVRANEMVASNPALNRAWSFVYPGRYDGNLTSRRQQGTESETWKPAADPAAVPPTTPEDEPWAPLGTPSNPTVKLGAADNASTRSPTGVNPAEFKIMLAAKDSPGPGAVGGGGTVRYPFGGFARVGDIMGVPFISAYRIFPAGGAAAGNLVELNAVTMDAIFAEDTDVADDKVEDIGRFAPVITELDANPNTSLDVNDFDPNGSYNVASTPRWHYRWAGKIFDYFTTINNPHDDYLPNAQATPNNAVPNGPDATTSAEANTALERFATVDGLINLNTAHWKVLSALPLAPPRAAAADPALNLNIARSIAWYRDVNDPATGKPHGPFTSLMDLMRVPVMDFSGATPTALRTFQNAWVGSNTLQDADDRDGDFSPEGEGQKDEIIDYKERFLTLNRISNLVTLRSDTFTCYVLVQGWRDAGSTSARLEVQRRLAFMVDRSTVRPSSAGGASTPPRVYNIPN